MARVCLGHVVTMTHKRQDLGGSQIECEGNTELFFKNLRGGMHHVLTELGRSVKMVKLSTLHNYAAVPDGGWKRSPLTAF